MTAQTITSASTYAPTVAPTMIAPAATITGTLTAPTSFVRVPGHHGGHAYAWGRPCSNADLERRLNQRFQDPRLRERSLHVLGGVHGSPKQGRQHANAATAFLPDSRYALTGTLLQGERDAVSAYNQRGGSAYWHDMSTPAGREAGLAAQARGATVMFGACYGTDNAFFPGFQPHTVIR
eukprot:TRINITY_DN75678_c0_g1_i1.p1 TRINITY_DN75678_c0_g1~~TRINITY_DN75678_c0_g1_i1.p1  ORF type:complete len:179 (-),score=12.85 TRINITY_DN75678_c0_g1_i1:25-561(-)